jgi:hypothetical protein
MPAIPDSRFVSRARAAELRRSALRLLEGNWREGARNGVPYGFTCPSPSRYRHQWYWDSCFHAIAWSHFDPARARTELRTLVRAMTPEGLIPHTIFWHEPPLWRRAPFYVTDSVFGDGASSHTQTPILALAWKAVADASGDEPGFATESLAAIRRHYDWLAAERDHDGDGLISILYPDESGLDATPKYDSAFGWMSHYSPGYWWLVQRSRRSGYDAGVMVLHFDEHVEDVMVNVLYALSLRALSELIGESPGGSYITRAEQVEAALLAKCWDERRGLFFDLAGRAERTLGVSTWTSLMPLALPSLPDSIAERLIEEHVLAPGRFGAPFGIPSVSMDEPAFRPGNSWWRCWRGPSWVNTAWLLVPPLRRHGYETQADRIVASLVEAVERHGFREYYNPRTGQGLGARDFGWSTLLVDLLPDPFTAPKHGVSRSFT